MDELKERIRGLEHAMDTFEERRADCASKLFRDRYEALIFECSRELDSLKSEFWRMQKTEK